MQQVPASADAFVWLRLYQEQLRGKVASGADSTGLVDPASARIGR